MRGPDRDELIRTIRGVGRGRTMLCPLAARWLVDWYRTRQDRHSPGPELSGLTPREREILELTSAGLSVTEIAERLFIGAATVRTHLYRLCGKLQVRNRAQLVAYAHRSYGRYFREDPDL